MWPFDKDKKQSDHEPSRLKKIAPKKGNLDQSDTFEYIADEESEKGEKGEKNEKNKKSGQAVDAGQGTATALVIKSDSSSDSDNRSNIISDSINNNASDNMSDTTSDGDDDEVMLPPEPELDPLVYGITGGVSYWGFSQRGESHIGNGAPCQDRCVIDVVNSSPLIIAGIADGVGSCMLSHYGAATATRSAVDYLKKELIAYNGSLDDAYVGDLLRSAMMCAYEAVRKEAEELEQLEYSFQSTLTLAIYDGSTLFFSHAGDDGIVAILEDGTMDLATVRKKGEEASSVVPLQGLDWETRKSTNVSAFVMATDGVLDAFVGGEVEGNRIYYPFIEAAVKPGQLTDVQVKEVAEFYYQYMAGPEYRSKVTDDLTMVVIANQKKITAENLPKFDKDAWDKYSAEREAQIKSALYPENEPEKNRKKGNTATAYSAQETYRDMSLGNVGNAGDAGEIFCDYCGEKVSLERAKFCPYCGAELRLPSKNDRYDTASRYRDSYGDQYRDSSKDSDPYTDPYTNSYADSYKDPYKDPYRDSYTDSYQQTSQGELKIPSITKRYSEPVRKGTGKKNPTKSSKKNDVYFSKGNGKKKSYKNYDYDFEEDRWWFDLDPVTFLLGVIVVAIVVIFASFFFH